MDLLAEKLGAYEIERESNNRFGVDELMLSSIDWFRLESRSTSRDV